jgi:hypothetical protein
MTRHTKELGSQPRREYISLRESYKARGMAAREAAERAYAELKIETRLIDFKRRRAMRAAMDQAVPLTEDEMREENPSHSPLRCVKAENIGDREMTVQEQIKWAMGKAARVQNGAEPPREFPCEGALFWYQSAVGNRREFEKRVERVEAPGGDPDNLYLQDSQYQYSEIEKQVRQAREEVRGMIAEMEREELLEMSKGE